VARESRRRLQAPSANQGWVGILHSEHLHDELDIFVVVVRCIVPPTSLVALSALQSNLLAFEEASLIGERVRPTNTNPGQWTFWPSVCLAVCVWVTVRDGSPEPPEVRMILERTCAWVGDVQGGAMEGCPSFVACGHQWWLMGGRHANTQIQKRKQEKHSETRNQSRRGGTGGTERGVYLYSAAARTRERTNNDHQPATNHQPSQPKKHAMDTY
jgi:hypothetical protein